MAIGFTVRQVFGLTPEGLFGVLGRPEVARLRATAAPELDGELLALTAEQDTLRMAVAATMPAAWLGGVAGTPRLIRTETWTRDGEGYAGEVELLAEGLPVTCTGTIRVDPEGTGSVLSMNLHLNVEIPMVGPMVEGKVADRIRAVMAAELQVLRELAVP